MKVQRARDWLAGVLGGRWLPLKWGAAVALVVLALQAGGAFGPLEHLFTDAHFALRGELPPSGKVVVVGVSPQCTRQFGQWPWPRRHHADLIRRLADAGARVICFDMYFSTESRDPANDAALAEAAADAGNVVLAVYKRDSLARNLGRDGPLLRVRRLARNIPALSRVTEQGHINVRYDRDGTIRRVPAGLLCGGRPYYQLGVVAAALSLGISPEEIGVEPGGLRLGDHLVPTDASGNLHINYHRMPDQVRPYFVSAILNGRVDPSVFRGRVVFVGQTDHGLQNADLVVTPEGERFGVFVQAQIADNLLSGRMLRRTPLPVLAGAVLVLSLACAWRLFARRALGKVTWSLGFAAAVVLVAHGAFTRGHLLLDLTPCLAVVVGNLGGALVVGILRADKEVERRDLEMAALLETAKLSTEGVDIAEHIVWSIGQALGAEGCCLFLRSESGQLELAGIYGFRNGLSAQDAARASEQANAQVAATRRALFTEGRSDAFPDPRIRSALVVPLASRDQLYGTLALYNKRPSDISPHREFTEHDFHLVSLLAQQATLTLDRAHLADHLQDALHHLEAAQQKLIESERLSAVGRMANMIIHDIKNPMQGIRMFAEMAAEADLSPEDRREFSATMCREIDRLAGMCQEILDFARGTTHLARQAVRFDDFLAEVLIGLAPELEQHRIELQTHLAFGGAASVDTSRTKRIVLNLCRNAIEAMADTGGTLRVATAAADHGAVAIEIADTGPGIPEDIVDSLFEPFVTQGKDHGTGLGLAIVKKVVEDHGGTIRFTTRAGKGTTFVVTLPTGTQEARNEQLARRDRAAAGRAGGGAPVHPTAL